MNTNTNLLLFIPPYCPEFKCIHHQKGGPDFFKRNGISKTTKAPFLNQKFKCRSCGRRFSENTFSIDFRKKIPDLNEDILHCSMKGMSNNDIADYLKIGETTVRNRLMTMSRQSLIFERINTPREIKEDIAYDGFETFTHSQFSPCYVNTSVGKQSHFIYHNTFSPLNRKGRMTLTQKIKQMELLEKHGPYPRNSVYQESRFIFSEIGKLARTEITLHTDEHKAYLRAMREINYCKIKHKTTSSLKRRDTNNPLFAVNRLHLLYRHFISSQHRETISFQKHEAALMEKLQLLKVYRNFMKPKFVKKNSFDKFAHQWSPAMYLNLTDRVLEFKDVFGLRISERHCRLDERSWKFLRRSYEFSRQKIAS